MVGNAMSHSQTIANAPPVPGPALLIICLHGDIAAMDLAPDNPVQTLLFSPDPPPAGAALPQAPRLRHIPAIPGPATTDTEALRYTMPGLASHGEPTTALRDLLPGLKVTGRMPVHRLGPQDLAPLLPAKGEIAVAIDCPGDEAGVLEALWLSIGPDRIIRITLRCGARAFFQGASDPAAVERMLQAQGYELTGLDASDPDWPVLCFQPDLKARQITALHGQVKDLRHSLADLTVAQTRSDAREAQLAEQIQSLQAGKEAVEQTLAAVRAEAGALRQSLASQTAAADEAMRKRDQILADQALSAQVQAMQALDLRDLRAQLERSEHERQRQEDLLRKLAPRLAQAAAHLHALQIGQPEPQPRPAIAPTKRAKLTGPQNPGKRRKAKP